MENNEIVVTGVAAAQNARNISEKQSNGTSEDGRSKTSFFRHDKNYRPREYDKTDKVLPPSQTDNSTAKKNETSLRCDTCNTV